MNDITYRLYGQEMEDSMKYIVKNEVKCDHCKDIIESTDTHDFKTCSCGMVSIDGGYDYCLSHNIVPDIIMGDFDSSENEMGDIRIPVKSFPPEKDYTDMALAAKEAIITGCDTILIYGGTGGRPDHTLANIQLLSNLSDKGIHA